MRSTCIATTKADSRSLSHPSAKHLRSTRRTPDYHILLLDFWGAYELRMSNLREQRRREIPALSPRFYRPQLQSTVSSGGRRCAALVPTEKEKISRVNLVCKVMTEEGDAVRYTSSCGGLLVEGARTKNGGGKLERPSYQTTKGQT